MILQIAKLNATFIPLTVQEIDGSPSVSKVKNITFNGATLTDLLNGRVLVTVAGGAGSAAGSSGAIQFNNSGALGASSNLSWNNGISALIVNGAITGTSLTINTPSGTPDGSSVLTINQNYSRNVQFPAGGGMSTAQTVTAGSFYGITGQGTVFRNNSTITFNAGDNSFADVAISRSGPGVLKLWNSNTGTVASGSLELVNLSANGNVDITNSLRFPVRTGKTWRPVISHDYTNGNFDIEYNGQTPGNTNSDPGTLLRLNSSGNITTFTKPGDGTGLALGCTFGHRTTQMHGYLALFPRAPYGNLVIQGFDTDGTYQQFRVQNYTSSFGRVPMGVSQTTAHMSLYGDGTTDLLRGFSSDGSTVVTSISANGAIMTSGTRPSTVLITAKGAASQTANLQEWQNNAGTVLSLVDASGNFGIGTTSPLANLHIERDSVAEDNSDMLILKNNSQSTYPYSGIVFDTNKNSGGNYINFKTNGTLRGQISYAGSGNALQLINSDNGPLTLQTNNTERMRIDSAGNVGIGTSSPARKLHITQAMRLEPLGGTQPASPSRGDLYSDNDTGTLCYYDGSAWVPVAGGTMTCN